MVSGQYLFWSTVSTIAFASGTNIVICIGDTLVYIGLCAILRLEQNDKYSSVGGFEVFECQICECLHT